ncbi:MAG: hypothetical protein ABI862_04510 [Ilumatobacteraceae bacterium]
MTERFDQLDVNAPLIAELTLSNTSTASHTVTLTVRVNGSSALPSYLNVNNDGTQTVLPNWFCSPGNIENPGVSNVFSCTAALTAGEVDTVFITTGSRFASAGSTISVISTVTTDNGSTANLPAAVTISGVV